ncbi:MAG: matrixin family metalloprotease [Polyangiaceae bacterium]
MATIAMRPARFCPLLVLLASACSAPSHEAHYFDPKGSAYISAEFTLEQADVVLGAIDAWREATSGEVDLKPQIGTGSPQVRPAARAERINGEFIPSESPEIVLDVDKVSDAGQLRNLTLHELGHAFGLQHIGHVDSVMFPMATTVQELDHWTLQAWSERSKAP